MNALLFLATVGVGLFAGSMLTEARVMVPDWRSTTPSNFFAWYAANGARLYSYFSGVTVFAGLSLLAAAGTTLWSGHPGRWLLLLATVLMLLCIAMFPLYFESVNASFMAASLTDEQLAAELTRWATWHWIRTVMAIVAFLATLRASMMR